MTAFALVGVAVAGCTAQTDAGAISQVAASPSAAAPQEFKLPEQNEALWTLPLDQAVMPTTEALLETYTSAILGIDCMNAGGYDFPTPYLDVSAMPEGRVDGALTEEVAAEAGYLGSTFDKAAWLEPLTGFFAWVDSQDAATTGDWQVCFANATDEMFAAGNPYDASNYVAMAVGNEVEAMYESQSVKEAVGRWSECIAVSGIAGAGESPRDMPTDVMMAALGMSTEDVDGYTVTEVEREAAVKDGRCRDSSGYNSAIYQAMWDLQIAILDEGDPQLNTALGVLQAWREKAQLVLAAHPAPVS